MEFGESVARGLRALGPDGGIDDASFQTLAEAAAKAALEEELGGMLDGLSIDGAKCKPALQGLATLFLEAAKFNVGDSEVIDALEEHGVESKRSKIVANIANGAKSAIRANLLRTTFSHPKILDVQWRVDHSVRTKYEDQIGEPTFMISILSSATADGLDRTETHFACTREELQNLVAKLKDACTQVDRILGTSR